MGRKAGLILAGRHRGNMDKLARERDTLVAGIRCMGLEVYEDASLEFLQEELMEAGLGFEDLDLMFVHSDMGDAAELYRFVAPRVGLFIHMPSLGSEEETGRWEEAMGGRPYGRFSDCHMFLKKEGFLGYLEPAVDYFMHALERKERGYASPGVYRRPRGLPEHA